MSLVILQGSSVTTAVSTNVAHDQGKKQWSLEQCHSKTMDLNQQPVGAEGSALGAVAVVQLQVKVDSTGIDRTRCSLLCAGLDKAYLEW